MHTCIRCLLFVLLCSATAQAQTTEDSVKAAVNRLFTAFKAADSAMVVQCFAPDAVLQTVTSNGVRTEPIPQLAGFIAKQEKNAADEQIVFDMIKIDGGLASVWTPYNMYFKQQFYHRGVNSFQLVRLTDGWKIQYIIDTRRK